MKTNVELMSLEVKNWIDQGQQCLNLITTIQRHIQKDHPVSFDNISEAAQDELRKELIAVKSAFSYVQSVSIISPQTGQIVLATPMTLEKRIKKNEAFFKKGLEGVFVSPVVYSVGQERPILTLSAPIRLNGKTELVVAIEMDLQNLQDRFKHLENFQKGLYSYLVDSYGFYVTVPSHFQSKPLLKKLDNTIFEKIKTANAGTTEYFTVDSRKVLCQFRWLEPTNLCLLVEMNASETNSIMVKIWFYLIFICGLIVILGAFLASYISRILTSPLMVISKAADDLREGRTNVRVDINYKDEIGSVASAFNHMSERVQATQADLENKVKERTLELKKIRDRYRTLFDNNPVQTMVFDKNAKILMYNFAEHKREGGLPKIGDIMYKDYASRHGIDIYSELMECIHSGGEKEFPELKYKDKYLHIRFSSFPEGAIITSIDITELKTLSMQLQQAQKMEAIGNMAGGVAHDFNNILGIILGNTELALDDARTWTPVAGNLNEIKTASLRARDVVKQLLRFSRKTKENFEFLKMDGIVNESVRLLRASIPTSIEIKLDLPPNISTIKANATQIQQIIINLCTNASHAMAQGGVLSVSLSDVELTAPLIRGYTKIKIGSYVQLAVKDTGHGIDPSILENIFDPYFTTKETGKGTGMGLAIVHGIVQNHGGGLSVESAPGEGTLIKVFIPSVKEVPAVKEESYKKMPAGNEQILFVDDEESIVDVTKKAFSKLGYTVKAFTKPTEALDEFTKNFDDYDVVITDMTMPQMSGDVLAKQILKIRPGIPIIICTGYSDTINIQNLKRVGVNSFLDKPIEINVLANAVREALNKKQINRSYDEI